VPRADAGSAVPRGIYPLPSRRHFLSTVTLISPSTIDCSGLLQIAEFVSRVRKGEMVLLLEKEHLGICSTLTAPFVRTLHFFFP